MCVLSLVRKKPINYKDKDILKKTTLEYLRHPKRYSKIPPVNLEYMPK
jgi:hypothetical protein